MSSIFLSHSSADNFEAVALRDWLAAEGWDDVFLDLDPERGIAAGERWERALHEAATRCEAVVFLVSGNWLASGWCLREYALARALNKKLFAVVVDLAGGQDGQLMRVSAPGSHEEKHVVFSKEGLRRLKRGLEKAGLDPKFFAWPPEADRERAPYRGLKPLEGVDAGIFFGREAPIVEAGDRLRGLKSAAPPRLLVILGASGAGKSSFLRAGLLPRLARDERNFLALPAIRPERAALTGENGLLHALDAALPSRTRAEIRAEIQAGAAGVRPLLAELVAASLKGASGAPDGAKPPTIVLAIDQAEELFRPEGADEGGALLEIIRDLVAEDAPAVIAIFAIRSDSYDVLEHAKPLEGLGQATLPLLPMPRGAFKDVIEGPARRYAEAGNALTIEPQLTERLLEDIDKGAGSDALPLLAFTLEQLFLDYRRSGALRLQNYEDFGGLKGAIDAAVERAFARADADPRVPRERKAREALLRRGLIPWLAGVDPDSKSPRRNIARRADIPEEAAPLIDLLVEERLLATDTAATKDAAGAETRIVTIEPAHEALLRQWGLLQGWLEEDFGLLATLEGVKRAARDWEANAKAEGWLAHQGQRLAEALALDARPDLAANLEPTDREYLAACRNKEATAKIWARRVQALIYTLFVGIIVGLVGWINQSYVKEQMNWFMTMRPYMLANIRPYVLTAEAERALKPLASFRECAKDCPEMIVVPAGEYTMGSPATENGRFDDEGPQRKVTIAKPFAVSKFDVTFADWQACVSAGGCPNVGDGGFVGDQSLPSGTKPVNNVSWDHAQQYVAWFSMMTGQPYRLLTEAEWEYAARAGAATAYFWGDDIGKGNANCNGCGSAWDYREPAPVGSFNPNRFGLYDMAGNLSQWVQDCYHVNYNGAPVDGSAWTTGNCIRRVVRGGAWNIAPVGIRSAARSRHPSVFLSGGTGFRVARTLTP
ncbi:MAG: SUMF1/EgtB/PvdO family nonheme iron enzyme [Roseiarcus sp.]|jgi:formylglycine-generating enzyme required for sulfatase activity